MDMSNVCQLIDYSYVEDEYKVKKKVENRRQIFCQIRSVSGSEFHDAGRNGIKAQYQLTVFKYDYNNEESVEVNGQKLFVYRKYERNDDFIELYLEKRAGV